MNKTEINKLLGMVLNEEMTDLGKLENIKGYLMDQLVLENAKQKGGNFKKQVQEAKKFLKSINGARPILKYVDYQDGYQVFTDSYVLYKMANHIEGLPYHENQNGTYPDVREFVPKEDNCENVTRLNNLNDALVVADLMKANKQKQVSKEYNYMIKGAHSEAYVNPLFVKQMLNILADDIENIEIYYVGSMRPILFKNSRGDYAIIVPVRFE